MFNLSHVTPCPTPMVAGRYLSIKEGAPIENPTYRQAIGALQYLTYSRLDICFAVNKLSQFLSAPTSSHWQVVKRLFRYLKGTINFKLHIKPSDHLSLSGFTDVDWASCLNGRRSTNGYCVFLSDSLVSWLSKKHKAIARSSTEGEYTSLDNLAAKLTWYESLMMEVGFKLTHTPVIWCDNFDASLAFNDVYQRAQNI